MFRRRRKFNIFYYKLAKKKCNNNFSLFLVKFCLAKGDFIRTMTCALLIFQLKDLQFAILLHKNYNIAFAAQKNSNGNTAAHVTSFFILLLAMTHPC